MQRLGWPEARRSVRPAARGARRVELGGVQHLAVRRSRLDSGLVPVYLNDQEVLRLGHLLCDARRRRVHVVERRSSPSADELMQAVLQIVLIVVVVAEEAG